MTQNQIAYFNAKEAQRHNVVTEKESGRHNVVTEQETGRHNVVTEQETGRHNVATENLESSNIDVKRASNDITQGHYQRMDSETNRSNLANETIKQANLLETQRHNVVSESIDASNAATNARNAETNYYNAQTNARNADTNATATYYNRLRDLEQQRHNVQTENIDRMVGASTTTYNYANAERAYAEQLLAEARVANVNADTSLKGAQTEKTEQEAISQHIENYVDRNLAPYKIAGAEYTYVKDPFWKTNMYESQVDLNTEKAGYEKMYAWSSLAQGFGRLLGGITGSIAGSTNAGGLSLPSSATYNPITGVFE